jgi:hypothetical protein
MANKCQIIFGVLVNRIFWSLPKVKLCAKNCQAVAKFVQVKWCNVFFQPMSLQVLPRLTKRAPDAGDAQRSRAQSAAISSLFLRLSIFPVGRRPAARPSAGNTNRWALVRKQI